ncbi:MAG TPA: prephenate dehydratase domain-containing protein [Candidatus Acidoferrales bacterium]|nr:prephenate dehydratase domain-containing protein [Candidatus Acidoferrales bacterium]
MKKYLVSFQGEKGAYSEIAAKHFFRRKNLDLVPYNTFADAIHAVAKRKVDAGIVPVENTLGGGIREVFNLLDEEPVYGVGEIKLKISHSLLALRGAKLSAIKKVYSHPQALLQCRKFIRDMKLTRIEYYDTAGAAKFISDNDDMSLAAIASEAAADDYGLIVLKKHLESDGRNFTRFMIISKKYLIARDADKTSVVFGLRNRPGELHRVLSVFAIRDIDILSIDSIPVVRKPWDYEFFVEFRGSLLGGKESNAISHLRELCPHVKVIGSFKSGRTIH